MEKVKVSCLKPNGAVNELYIIEPCLLVLHRSSLKNCQTYIDTGMDITTGVALHLLQTDCDTEHVGCIESIMLEYTALNRDINQYIDAVEETVLKLKRDPPDKIPDLRELVHERYTALQKNNTEEALREDDKYVQFKEQLRDLRKQMGVSSAPADEALEDEDEEIAITQSTPITQLETVNPVENKVCGHTYQREAIERMIENKLQKGKSARCPKIGCDHSEMSISNLVPNNALKRAIDIHSKKH
ncbi:E3 SUMO-protein ligase NSE2-like [Mixophyes fleayi]|uniref:E3 SUMO-protein ligase NSE2-like n=1 Tax=Mixophyes fleayi TaxID=3061075 RepID=UPI003F4E3929